MGGSIIKIASTTGLAVEPTKFGYFTLELLVKMSPRVAQDSPRAYEAAQQAAQGELPALAKQLSMIASTVPELSRHSCTKFRDFMPVLDVGIKLAEA